VTQDYAEQSIAPKPHTMVLDMSTFAGCGSVNGGVELNGFAVQRPIQVRFQWCFAALVQWFVYE